MLLEKLKLLINQAEREGCNEYELYDLLQEVLEEYEDDVEFFSLKNENDEY